MLPVVPEAKNWGFTCPLLRSSEAQAYFAVAKKGGASSIHFHINYDNIIFVTEGLVELAIFDDSLNAIETQELAAGFSTRVPALVCHKFTAMKESKFIELYIKPEVSEEHLPLDITRITESPY